MMVFKRKQVVILSLVLLIIVAGYLQYTYNQSSNSTADKESVKTGEAVYVDNNESAAGAEKDDKSEKSLKASKEAEDFFAQAKLDKEMSRSKDTDSLKEISEDPNATNEAKDKAYEQRMKIVASSEKEMRIETLIKEKGFGDVIVLLGDDDSLDIIVKAPTLTTQHVAQITDAASRQAQIPISNIHVKNIF